MGVQCKPLHFSNEQSQAQGPEYKRKYEFAKTLIAWIT